jgi:hypothetical protein
MAHSSIVPPAPRKTPPGRKGRIGREARSIWHEAPLWVHVVIVAVGALLATAVVLISSNWPYRHRKIAPLLEDVLASQVTFTGYHRTYFPKPGFVATGITMRRRSAPDLPPLGHVDTMVVQGTWSDLIMLRRRAELVDITGDGTRFSFPIQQLEIQNLHKGEALTYTIDMQNAIPTGRILAHGTMGPIVGEDILATPVTGNFAFTQVNLHDVGDISGILDARGGFKGNLRMMNVETTAETRNFAVDDGKPTPLSATMQGTLYGSNGDMDIHAIEVKIRETTIHAAGSIKGAPKLTKFDISVEHGRAEDIMQPFVQDEVPITGSVWLKSNVYVGPPGDGFMQMLRMTGSLDVPAEKISDPQTEKNLSAFSDRAQGNRTPNTGVDPDNKPTDATKDALSSLQGGVRIENGVVSTSRFTFKVPGAQATMAGTFRFRGEVAHLTGDLKMDTDISHAATGFKSFLLKPLAPFFKKKNAGAVVPIAVTGTPGHYRVTQDITHNK